MRSAVQNHLTDLTPEKTGAYLSGGTDSSSVVAFMNERHSPSTPTRSFLPNPLQRNRFCAHHRRAFPRQASELSLTSRDTYDAIPKLMEYYDEPFANSSAIGAYPLLPAWRAKPAWTTLLAGDGGDELFAGNERYATDKRFSLYRHVPAFLRKGLIEPVSSLLPPK